MSKRGREDSLSKLNRILPIPIQLESPEDLESPGAGAKASSKLGNITNVIVGDHHLIAGDNGANSFVVWCIKIIINDLNYGSIVVYKRYSEIESLHRTLREKYPESNVPDMPPKDNMSIQRWFGQDEWLETRRKGLQWFLSNVLLNPRLQDTEVVKKFLFG